MKLTVTFRHLESTKSLKNHVEAKLEKLNKFLIKPIDVHVILSVEKFRKQCEITLNASNFHTVAIETNGDMYASIDNAVHKLESQIRKHKEKIKEHHHLPLHTVTAIAEKNLQVSPEMVEVVT
jgi:putative sigma-54 modulation protein